MDKSQGRILRREELEDFRKSNSTEKIVFTNGCFDLIHRGHIELLRGAGGCGDCLVVGINSDASMRRLKGISRPLVKEGDRAYILLQIRSVDYVTVFDEDTPLETIMKLKPDVLVKGAEYSRDNIVGADFVEETGGRVERVEMLGDYSTSGIIEKIKKEL